MTHGKFLRGMAAGALLAAVAFFGLKSFSQISNPTALPTQFVGATCVGCSMVDANLTGTPLLNSTPLVQCSTTPAADTVDGTPGAAAPCIPKADSSRPARGLWTRATSDGSCNVTWTFGRTFTTPVISVTTQDAGLPVIWSITALSGTGVTLRANRMQLLPASLTLITNLQAFNVTAGTCSGITAHLGVREQLLP